MDDEFSKERIVFDHHAIMRMLPHRYPFLLVDRIVHLDLEKNYIVGQKNITMNEQFFNGHFPFAPIMPGVLVTEALAQTGGILIHEKGYHDKIAVLMSVNNAKFRKTILPGDVLFMHVQGLHFASRGGRVKAQARVQDRVVAEVEIGFGFVERSQLSQEMTK
ncbi:MAG: 3-hydroxyacyl-ACP dehydratase FabZ [Simkaniaceae bacterium]|nr:3-hydroxyacyl-ACP dehydratase FabZ [Simkaniaceae bacterium]MCF7851898.1 3-hydroxyacyl-ACP dehydratase FabZ [Simkaniaceae bacterium]